MYKLFLFLLCVPGCASLMPVDSTLPIVALKADKATSSRANVDVVMEPVSYQDAPKHRDLLMKFEWVARDDGQSSRSVQGTGKLAFGVAPILPLPVIAVRVVNHSSAPLDFTKATFDLGDDKGKHWPIYKDLGALSGRAWSDVVLRFPNLQTQPRQQDTLSNIIASTKIIDHSTVVPPNSELVGYVVFKVDPQTPNELESYLASVQKLTVHIASIGPDSASIDVPLIQDKGQLLVTCDGGKPQTIATCKQRPYE